MQKIHTTGLFACAVLISGISQSVYATNTINFEGEITAATCSVTVTGQTGDTGTVKLPPVSVSDLAGPGSVAGKTDFSLSVSECDMGSTGFTTVAAYFEPDAVNVDTASGYLNNTAVAGAKDVQLRLTDLTSNAVIKAGDAAQVNDAGYVTVDADAHTATLPYSVEYISVLGGATSGAVKGSVTYNLIYQ